MAKLLQRAELDFAILGPSEQCTGDPARRSGNEYIFQMLAMANIESLNGMGVKKIITQCPHCFNTLLNEYPQLGGHFEVIHHSQLLEQLIDSGRLDLRDARLEERVVYHDSCYLGRHNDVYLSPRNVIGSLGGIEVVEAGRNGTKGMCCGAGGARMWMEESIGTKVNDARAAELIATGASKVATACPFCYIMLDDGVKGAGAEETVQVADISMHVLAALEAADAARARLRSSRRSRTEADRGAGEAEGRAVGRRRAPGRAQGARRERRPGRLRDARAHGRTKGYRAIGATSPDEATWPHRRRAAALHRARPRRRWHRHEPQGARHDPQPRRPPREHRARRAVRREPQEPRRSRSSPAPTPSSCVPFHLDELTDQIADVLGRAHEDRARHRRDELARHGD